MADVVMMLKEEARLNVSAAAQKLEENEGSRTSEGMFLGISSVQAAVLTLVSLLSLSLLSLLCIRCKRKSKTIHEEHQIYNPQTFQRGGSVFAVTRSKTVTRGNPISSVTDEPLDEFDEFPPASANNPLGYGNMTRAQSTRLEHEYVAPLQISEYENDKKAVDPSPGIYANIESSQDDEDDYENSDFLKQQEEEPDYVNENGE